MKQKVRVAVKNEINQHEIVLRPMIVFLRNEAKDHFMVCVFSGKTKLGWILYDGIKLKNLIYFPNADDHSNRSGRVAVFHTKPNLKKMTEGFHVDSILFEITNTNERHTEPEKAASEGLLASCKKGDSDLRFDEVKARNLNIDTQGFRTNVLVSFANDQ